jgi:threonine synthase
VRHLRDREWLTGAEEVVVLNTGAGIKYPGTVPANAPTLSREDRIPLSPAR